MPRLRRKQKYPILKIANPNDVMEIIGFDNSEFLSEKLRIELLQNGWKKTMMDGLLNYQMQNNVPAFYNKSRDLILVPFGDDDRTTLVYSRTNVSVIHFPGYKMANGDK